MNLAKTIEDWERVCEAGDLKDLVATLRKCETAIESLPSDALGIGGDGKSDSTRWYRRDELLSEIREVLDGN